MSKIKPIINVTIFDRTQTDIEWAQEIGISFSAFYTRRYRYPDSQHMWIKKPGYLNTNVARRTYLVNEDGIKKSIDNWMKHYKVVIPDDPLRRNSLKQKLKWRVKQVNWSFDRAFTDGIFREE